MKDISDLNPMGATVNGCIASLMNTTLWQGGYAIKNVYMAEQRFAHPRMWYRGFVVNAACDMLNQAVAFPVNNIYRNVIMQSKPLSSSEQMAGGFFSGTVSSIFLTPLERIMVTQQFAGDIALSISQAVAKIFKREGVRGFVHGFTPTCTRESLGMACFFGLSLSIKKIMPKQAEESFKFFSPSFFTAGVIGGLCTTPADLIRVNMQKTGKSLKQTVIDLTASKDGVRYQALLRGCLPRMALIGALLSTLGPFSRMIPQYLPDAAFRRE